MKKIMILVAVVAMAFASQAASFKWTGANIGSSCMTVGGFPLLKFAWPLFYGLLSRSSGPRNFD